MPHTFTNRTRKFANLFSPPHELPKHFRWEKINAGCYELGGILFVIASVLYLPYYERFKTTASRTIIAASTCFLIVSLHDCLEFLTLGKDIRRIDFIALALYILGSSCLIHGAFYFFPETPSEHVGYFSFALASISFIIGSILNSLLIFESPTRRTAQYFLLTAISFIIGSTMFLVGSTAHVVLSYRNPQDETVVDSFLASFYIAGSVMFCIGGIFHALRSSIVMRRDVREQNRHRNLLSRLLFPGSEESKYGSTANGEATDDEEITYAKDKKEDLSFGTT